MTNSPLYQSERSECGLVSLAMIASAHGLQLDLASLRARYPVSTKGATLKALIDIAADLGLDTRAVRCEVEDLGKLSLPALLHWRMDHFVVLVACRRGRYVINDPAVGRVVVSRAEIDETFTGIALEAWPGPKFQRQDRRNRLRLGTVIPRSPGLVAALVQIVVYALAIEIIVLLLPILQQLVIDDALVTGDGDLLKLLVAATAVFLIGQAATGAIRSGVQRNLSSTLSVIVPAHVFHHMVRLPVAWFERRSAADILNRFGSANTIHQTITTTVISAGIDGLVAVIALAAMAAYSIKLTAIVLVAFLAYVVVRIAWYDTYRNQSQGLLVQASKLQGLMWETMRGISTIKLCNGLVQRQGQYLSTLSQGIRLQNRVGTSGILFGFIHDLLFAVEHALILYLGAQAVLAGTFSVGMLTAFLSFRGNFVGKASSLVDTTVSFRILSIHLDRLADILLTRREHTTRLPFLGDDELRGEIEVRKVCYRYGEHEADVLKDCTLRVAAGEAVAIVGPSGAGKSTLFKILTGQIQPKSGSVQIDGIPLDAMGLDRLRAAIAVVRQDDMLFSGTITENIAFLEETPDHERVRAAAVKAAIHDEIQKMPMGYNTLIGSMGTGLSGGQAQRVTLARALYRNPRILLLDEATSHLDVENERKIAQTLRGLGITQIIVAHRPETIARADRVVDINEINGKSDGVVVAFDSARLPHPTPAAAS